MNQNDTEREYWRTGHRWSGDQGLLKEIRGRVRLTTREVILLIIVLLVTLIALVRVNF
jgi:hypothetical protein